MRKIRFMAAAGLFVVLVVSWAKPDFDMVFMDVIKAFGVAIGLGAIILLSCVVPRVVRAGR